MRLLYGKNYKFFLQGADIYYTYTVQINTNIMSFSVYDLERRTAKNTFFKQMNFIINWKSIFKIINYYHKVGISVNGKTNYDGLLLFKMLLIGIWYDLSEHDVI